MQRLVVNINAVKDSIANKSDENAAPTIFHGIIQNPNVPETDKSTARLVDEAIIFLGAGTDTTAQTMVAITYHLLSNPEILGKLKAELAQAIPDVESLPESSKLEALPYLTAVIQESIRLHPGAVHRQERVAPDEDLFYEDPKSGEKFLIPQGVCFLGRS
jgi:cytochrome P450